MVEQPAGTVYEYGLADGTEKVCGGGADGAGVTLVDLDGDGVGVAVGDRDGAGVTLSVRDGDGDGVPAGAS